MPYVAKNVTGFQLSNPRQWAFQGWKYQGQHWTFECTQQKQQENQFQNKIRGPKRNKEDSLAQKAGLVPEKAISFAQQARFYHPVGLSEVSK